MDASLSQNWATVAGESRARPELDLHDAHQIAHKFNNLLAVIGGHADILLRAVPIESPLRRSLNAIHESTVRAGVLTRKLLEIADRDAPAVDPIDPGSLFLKIEADARERFGHRIAFDMEAPQPLWRLRADTTRMEHAIWTIASYAIDAMPYGGAITFRATNSEVTPDDPRGHAFVKEGRYVRLDIVCSRTIGQEDWLNDFEPLRERAARDGVDLATMFGQIKRSGGYLWIGTDESSSETALTMMWPAA